MSAKTEKHTLPEARSRARRDKAAAVRDKADAIREAEQRVLAAACDTTLDDAVNALVALGWEPKP